MTKETKLKFMGEGGSSANKTYSLYKGASLWFLDYNDQGLYHTIYVGNSKKEVLANFEAGEFVLYEYNEEPSDVDDGGTHEECYYTDGEGNELSWEDIQKLSLIHI